MYGAVVIRLFSVYCAVLDVKLRVFIHLDAQCVKMDTQMLLSIPKKRSVCKFVTFVSTM